MTIPPKNSTLRRIASWVPIVVMGCMLMSCTPSHFPLVKPSLVPSPTLAAQIRAENHFIAARDYERRGLLQMAERFYEMAYQLDPQSDVLREKLTSVYLQLSKHTQALVLIKGKKRLEELSTDDRRLLARIYFRIGQLNKAVEAYETVSPKTAEEYFTIAMIHEMMGLPLKAIDNYRECLARSPGSLQPIGVKVGSLYLKMGDLFRAESVYQFLDRNFENNSEALNGRAMVSLFRGDTTRALDFFTLASGLDSSDAEANRWLAQLYLLRGDYRSALPYFEKLTTSEQGAPSLRTLALLYYYNDKLDSARSLLERILKAEGNDHELHLQLGLVLAAQSENDLARNEFEKSVALAPDYVEGWRQLCFFLSRNKQWDDAIDAGKRFVEKTDGPASAFRTLGVIYAMKQDYAEAIPILRKAVEIDSTDAQAWFELGSALERTKNIDEAAAKFQRALMLKPGDAATSNYLAYMWAEAGKNLDSAESLLKLALGKDPENGAYLDSYAWVLYQKGDYEQAHTYILRALKHVDNDPTVYEHLGDILVKKGNLREAAQAYRKSIELGNEHPDAVRTKLKHLPQKTGPGQLRQ